MIYDCHNEDEFKAATLGAMGGDTIRVLYPKWHSIEFEFPMRLDTCQAQEDAMSYEDDEAVEKIRAAAVVGDRPADLCARLRRFAELEAKARNDLDLFDEGEEWMALDLVAGEREGEAAARIAELEQQVEHLHIGRAKRFEELDAAEARIAELEQRVLKVELDRCRMASAVERHTRLSMELANIINKANLDGRAAIDEWRKAIALIEAPPPDK